MDTGISYPEAQEENRLGFTMKHNVAEPTGEGTTAAEINGAEPTGEGTTAGIYVSGKLTMDDCSANPGTCKVPIMFLNNGNRLDIRGDKYTGGIWKNSYNVTYNIGVNAGSHTQVQIADIKHNLLSERYEPVPKIEGNFNLLNPTPNYYTSGNTTMVFAGWAVSLDANDGGRIITDTDKKSIDGYDWDRIENGYKSVWADKTEGSIYLADRWAEGHTVTYDYSDGATPGKTVGVVSGESITLETLSGGEGYMFGGWKEDSSGETYNGGFSFKPTTNTTLTAQWKHRVTYKYDDGSTADRMVDVVSGEAITLETPTRSGHTFNGWKAEPGGQILVGEASFKPATNTTLTAQWTQNPGGGSNDNTSSEGNTPSGGNTVTPPGTTPDNNSDKDTTNWNSIKSDVTKAKDGDTVTIDLSKTTTVPGEIFDSIRGKDVTLVLDLGNGMSWRINGNSITADKIGNINFSVDFDSKTIPVEVINKVSGERYTMRLSLAHDGPFGMEAVLSVDLDEKNAGLYANLFYFNPETEELEFVEDDIITDKGAAEFTFTHASDYAIIIDKESMDPSIPAKGTKLTDRKTKAVYKVTKAGKTGGTVAYMGSTDKKATKIVIPATVTIDGITYKVTAVGAKAFIKNKTLQKIIIGKNVKKIGKKAFYGCKNLKKIVIKTTRLTDETVGSKAFQKIAAKVKIRVPEEKLDAYSKLLKEKGLGDKAVVKK